jgi:hypothetical protein
MPHLLLLLKQHLLSRSSSTSSSEFNFADNFW